MVYNSVSETFDVILTSGDIVQTIFFFTFKISNQNFYNFYDICFYNKFKAIGRGKPCFLLLDLIL